MSICMKELTGVCIVLTIAFILLVSFLDPVAAIVAGTTGLDSGASALLGLMPLLLVAITVGTTLAFTIRSFKA